MVHVSPPSGVRVRWFGGWGAPQLAGRPPPPGRRSVSRMTDGRELYEQILAEEAELRVGSFGKDDAWDLGCRMRAAAAAQGLPIAIGIVLAGQRVFHAALEGSSADNDGWL